MIGIVVLKCIDDRMADRTTIRCMEPLIGCVLQTRKNLYSFDNQLTRTGENFRGVTIISMRIISNFEY